MTFVFMKAAKVYFFVYSWKFALIRVLPHCVMGRSFNYRGILSITTDI